MTTNLMDADNAEPAVRDQAIVQRRVSFSRWVVCPNGDEFFLRGTILTSFKAPTAQSAWEKALAHWPNETRETLKKQGYAARRVIMTAEWA